MKKRILAVWLSLVLILGILVMPTYATQSKSSNFDQSYSLSNDPAADIVAVASKQVGKTKSDLGYTESWCADFATDCARLTGMSDSIIPYNYSGRGSCASLYSRMVNYCGATPVSTRKQGDLVFYYCSACGRYVHVGIVVDSTYSIEGDYDGKVTKVSSRYSDGKHSIASGEIERRYLRPNYSSSNTYTVDTRYKLSFKAYPIANDKTSTTAYDSVNGSVVGHVYGDDLCTIEEIYTNGWCKVNCPWYQYSNGRTIYCKLSDFVYNTSYTPTEQTSSRGQLTLTARYNDSSVTNGWIRDNETIWVVSERGSGSNKWLQILEWNGSTKYYYLGWIQDNTYTVDTRYKLPFKAYPIANDKTSTTAYDSVNGSVVGHVYGDDLCTIEEIYTNGWCKVNCPWYQYSNGRTIYCKLSDFVYNTSYTPTEQTSSRGQLTLTARYNDSSVTNGWIRDNETIWVVSERGSGSSKWLQILEWNGSTKNYYLGWIQDNTYTVDTRYKLPFKAYPIANDKTSTTAYDSVNGSVVGHVYGDDLCTIEEIYTNGWCKVNCPWYQYSNGRTIYCKLSDFVYDTAYIPTKQTSTRGKLTLSARYHDSSVTNGWIRNNETIWVVSERGSGSSKWLQILEWNGSEKYYFLGWILDQVDPYTNTSQYAKYTGIDYTQLTSDPYRISALNKARDMTYVKWTAPVSFVTWLSSGGVYNKVKDISGQSSTKFLKGHTYIGVPYSMNHPKKNGVIQAYDDVGWLNLLDSGITSKGMSVRYYSKYTNGGTSKGIDCSYFTYTALDFANTGYKLSYQTTSQMLSSSAYSKLSSKSQLLPGDLLLKNGHVMMYVGKDSKGNYCVFEADASHSKCSYSVYSPSSLSKYKPYRFKGFK